MKKLSVFCLGFFLASTIMSSILFHSESANKKQRKLSVAHKNKSSKQLHNLFSKISKEERGLFLNPLHLMGPKPGVFTMGVDMKSVFGGKMNIKMPDTPSPIFVNQSPFYSF